MSYCLIKPLADKFRQALKEGKINPEKLADMASEDRRTFFEGIVGKDNAVKVNVLFETEYLLKDKQAGMIKWAKQITGIKPEIRNSLIERIQKMDERILNPADEKAFLQDLANKRMGTEITLEEAKQITALSNNLAKAKQNISSNRIEVGSARVALENYLNDIKRENNKVKLSDLRTNPAGTGVRISSDIAGYAKSLKATLDVSALGRQGFKAIFTHPKQWATGAAKTFLDVWKTLKTKTSDEGVMNAIKADIYSRDNALDGTYKRMKLDIGTGEEAYPSSLPEKIPLFGRVFKASEIAYNGFLMRLRADIADRYIKVALDQGVDLKDPFQAESIGRLVNSLTGRGSLGRAENAGKTINTLFFAPKNVKASFDFLTAHTFEKTSGFARKQAAINLVKVAAGVATIFSIVKALHPDSVETDPRSADFGKIKVRDTRFDVSGGMASMITLAVRLLTASSKSSISGKISPLGMGYGQTSPFDVLVNYIENKLSPSASFVKNIVNRTDREGKPLTIQGELKNLFVPLPITNAMELAGNSKAANLELAMIADALGLATNTYSEQSTIAEIFGNEKALVKTLHDLSNEVGKPISFTNWDTTNRADIQALRVKLGDVAFAGAKDRYIYQVQTRLADLMKDPRYAGHSSEEKIKLINQIDEASIKKVFSQENFSFKKPAIKKVKL